MGLLENDNIASTEEENLDELIEANEFAGLTRHRGMLILNWKMHVDWKEFLQSSIVYIFYFHTDNSERAFYKELVKVIEASDVILEVLDARDPLGTRCVDMEKMVMKSGAEKHLVLLLNKIGN